MKDFITTLKQMLQIHQKELLFYGLVPTIIGLFGTVIMLIAIFTLGSMEGYVEMGAMLAIISGFVLVIFGNIFTVQNKFHLAISMGKTRKAFTPAVYVFLLLEVTLLLAIIRLLGLLERFIITLIYPDIYCILPVTAWMSNPMTLLGFALGIPSLILLLAACIIKFTAKFFWILWALWMFGCFGIPRIISEAIENSNSIWGRIGLTILQFFQHTSATAITAILGISILLGIFLSEQLLKKQGITG